MGSKAVALATYNQIRARLRSEGMIVGEQLRVAQTRILRNEFISRPGRV